MEIDVGSWSGLTRADIEARFLVGFARWREGRHGWDDGETNDDLGVRVVAGLLEIGTRHPDLAVLAVTHGVRFALHSQPPTASPSTARTARFTASATARVVELAVREGALE